MAEFRGHYRSFLILLLFLTGLLIYAYATRAQALTLADTCTLSDAASVTLIDLRPDHFNGWTAQPDDDPALIARIGAWAGDSIWERSGDYGTFAGEPPDALLYWELDIRLAGGGKRFLFITTADSTPETVYVYPYFDLEANTDAEGDHYGAHHFCTEPFAMPSINIPDSWWWT